MSSTFPYRTGLVFVAELVAAQMCYIYHQALQIIGRRFHGSHGTHWTSQMMPWVKFPGELLCLRYKLLTNYHLFLIQSPRVKTNRHTTLPHIFVPLWQQHQRALGPGGHFEPQFSP